MQKFELSAGTAMSITAELFESGTKKDMELWAILHSAYGTLITHLPLENLHTLTLVLYLSEKQMERMREVLQKKGVIV